MCENIRKRCFVAALLLGFALQSCGLVSEVIPEVNPEQGITASSTVYTIKQGGHYADRNSYKKVSLDRLRFSVTFDNSAIYTTVDPSNQGDINKLYGFSDCDSEHHTNSARFGWRWYEGKLELHAYSYVSQIRQSSYVADIAIGKAAICEIKLENEQYVFSVDGKAVSLPRACNGTGKGYKLYTYFGGDETAPHDVTIEIKDLP